MGNITDNALCTHCLYCILKYASFDFAVPLGKWEGFSCLDIQMQEVD